MYVIMRNKVFALEYPKGHPMQDMKWAWTLDRYAASEYPTREEADAKAKAFGIKTYHIVSVIH